MAVEDDVRFACDAMLGGLARWLRAAGFDASFDANARDGELVRTAAEEGLVLLSSDGGIFERRAVKRGRPRAVFVPRATPPTDQLRHVLRELGLALREPRCMACGGELVEVPRPTVFGDVPPRSFAAFDRFWRCARCRRLFWRGTHWTRIAARLAALGLPSTAAPDAP